MKKLSNTTITVVWVATLLSVFTFGSAFSIPSLSELLNSLAKLITQDGLLYELGISLKLNVEVILISTILSVSLAYLTANRWFAPPSIVFSKFRFFGMIGFVVVFTRIFGGGHALKVSMLVFIMTTFFLTSMLDVVNSVTKEEFDHTRTLKMSRLRSVWEVIVLGRLDQTFDALRQNAAIGWMSLTMVEGLVKFEGGVGVIMLNEQKYRNLAAIFAVQLVVLVIGIIQDQFLGWLKNVCCPHSRLALETK